MTAAFNAVRFRVKPERDQDFLNAHDKIGATWPGLLHANIIKTGDRSYCIIAEWEDMDACIQARPNMIATLNSFRDTLEDLGGGLGSGAGRLSPEIVRGDASPMPARRVKPGNPGAQPVSLIAT
jgi:antibiotic biosynthesis monooxygenase